MKNVLIISQFFAPQNVIAAIRFTKMVKYLARTGKYHFYVISADHGTTYQLDELLQKDIENVSSFVSVKYVNMPKNFINGVKKIVSKNQKEVSKTTDNHRDGTEKKDIYYQIQEKYVCNKQSGIVGITKRNIGKAIFAANDVYDLMCEKKFAIMAKKMMAQIPFDTIDVMISTYGQAGTHMLALNIKKKYPRMNWIVDYRDPVTGESGIKRVILNQLAVKADQKAKYITGATDSCIGSGKYPDKFRVIPNGYDRDDIKDIEAAANDRMTICYTGSVYYGKSDMSLLFQILSELIQEGKMDKERIRIVYAGSQFHSLKRQAEQYDLAGVLCDKGFVTRKQSLTIQKQADILCALTWNNHGNDNILTGKVLEYFMMDKPIFAVVTGNKPGSMLKCIIQEADLGYCLEEVEAALFYDEAKKWILKSYEEFITQGRISCSPKEKILEAYSSQRMAERFEQLIDDCN